MDNYRFVLFIFGIFRYPVEDWPIIAFTGTPGSFPLKKVDVELHKYLKWSNNITSQSQALIKQHLQRPYIGAHLRIGSDWVWNNTYTYIQT